MPKKTILLAEDDESLNQMISRMLESQGYLVLRAMNGEEALALFEANSPDIALVISDIEMPKMSGVELSNILRKQNPQLKIVLMSATFPETHLLSLQLNSYDRFIAKPFEIFSFLSIIEAFISL
jgi:CheY-like chemotaxis protein